MTNTVQSVTKKTQPKRKQNPKRVDRDGYYLVVRALAWYLSDREAWGPSLVPQWYRINVG